METRYTCKYKIVWRDRERPKETKETLETVETSGGTWKYYTKLYEETGDQRRLKRLWRPMVIHAIAKLFGETERD